MIPEAQIDQILSRLRELEQLLSEGPAGDDHVRLSKEYAELSPVAEGAQGLRDLQREIADLGELIADPANDPEMRELAAAEFEELKARLPDLERELQLLLLPRDAADEKSAILEIRAGTGGDEAALFAGDLLRMYQRYADLRGWRLELMSTRESDLGGIREVIVSIKGRGAFARLKFESGVHRVQRVPETESGGRLHTSAATVAVLPEVEEIDVDIQDKETGLALDIGPWVWTRTHSYEWRGQLHDQYERFFVAKGADATPIAPS